MANVFYRGADLGEQNCLPLAEPPQDPAVTFSAQRYDPLRLPPTLLVGGGATEQIFHNVEEMILADLPAALLSSLAFPPPRAVLSQNFTRSDDGAHRRGGRDTLARKLQNSYKNAGKCACSAKRMITARLLTSGAAIRDAFRCIYDATVRIVRPLIEVVRGMVPEWAPVTRVLLN